MDIKQKAQAIMQREKLCVISTVTIRGKSESALVAFSANEKFELMMGTSKNSRKFKNITANPNVSVVIGFDKQGTLQYEGVAQPIESEELKNRLDSHFKTQPGAEKYQSDPSQVYLVVKPTWIRLTKSGPVVLGEIKEFL